MFISRIKVVVVFRLLELFGSRHRKKRSKVNMASRFLSLCALLAGIFLSLITAPATALAASYNVADGDVTGLITAINTANMFGSDATINLANNGTYTLTAVDNTDFGYGGNGLPPIKCKIIINGNGSTIQRSSAAATLAFRLFIIPGQGLASVPGNLTLNNLTLKNGNATGIQGFGGGVFNLIGTAAINNVIFDSNSAGSGGGGLENAGGTLTVTNTTFKSNFAGESGGGINNDVGMTTVINSTFISNTAGSASAGTGGGIANSTNTGVNVSIVSVTNSTFYNNLANSGGGVYNGVGPNSAAGSTITLTVTNSTFLANIGAGITNSKFSINATATIYNSLLVNNTFSGLVNNCNGPVATPFTTGSNNLEYPAETSGNPQCGGGSSIAAVNPLGSNVLANNGGPTQTIALAIPAATNPAVDTGNSLYCPATDQRGVSRQGVCDIGAYEYITVFAPTISKSFGVSSIPLNGTTSLSFTISNPNASIALSGVAFTDNLPVGLVVATPNGLTGSCGGSAVITATPADTAVSLTAGSLPAASSCTFSVSVKGSTTGVKNNQTGPISSTESGAGVASNLATLKVIAPPTITKAFGQSSIEPNATTSLTFTITNPNAFSGGDLSGIAFTDPLPAGLVVATPNGLTGNCGGGTVAAVAADTSVSLSAGSLANNTSCTISLNVKGLTVGVKDNQTGAISSTEGGTGTTSNVASLTVAVAVVNPPTLTLAFSKPTVTVNETFSLAFTIANPNPSTALSGISFSDTLPAGLIVATPNSLTGSCGTGTISAVAAGTGISLSGGSLAGNTSCSFSVNLVASGAASKTNQSGTISATESGAGTSSNQISLNVNKATLVLGLLASPNPSVAGQSVGLSATLSASATTSLTPTAPTSTITFSDGANTLGSTVALSGLTASYSTSSLSAGSHTLKASYSGDANFEAANSPDVTQTVNPVAPVLVSLALSPANPSIVKNATRQFTANGTYSDSSTQDLSNSVTWNSSNSTIATISNSGLATGLSAGNTTITATSGSISATTILTVTNPLPKGLVYYPLPKPIRVLDTRTSTGIQAKSAGGGPITASTARNLIIANLNYLGVTIPAQAQAIEGNVQVAGPNQAGFLTAYPGPADPNGANRPVAATILYNPGQFLANEVTLTLGIDGSVNIFAFTTTDVLLDITGYYAPAATPDPNQAGSVTNGLVYHSLIKPIRLIDTRTAPGTVAYTSGGGPLAAGSTRSYPVANLSFQGVTIPASAKVLVGNTQVASPEGAGYLTAYAGPADPTGANRPLVASMLYNPGQFLANGIALTIGSNGTINLYSSAKTEVLLDITGYYSLPESEAGGLSYYPLSKPTRLLDTRAGSQALYSGGGAISGGSTKSYVVAGISYGGVTIPAEAKALVGNTQVAAPQATGFLTAYPGPADVAGANRPLVASMLYNPGQFLANALVIGVGSDGSLNIYAFSTSEVLLDVTGYFV